MSSVKRAGDQDRGRRCAGLRTCRHRSAAIDAPSEWPRNPRNTDGIEHFRQRIARLVVHVGERPRQETDRTCRSRRANKRRRRNPSPASFAGNSPHSPTHPSPSCRRTSVGASAGEGPHHRPSSRTPSISDPNRGMRPSRLVPMKLEPLDLAGRRLRQRFAHLDPARIFP